MNRRKPRIAEPSTHAGIAAALAAVAPVAGPASPYLIAAAGIFSALAVALREGPTPPAPGADR